MARTQGDSNDEPSPESGHRQQNVLWFEPVAPRNSSRVKTASDSVAENCNQPISPQAGLESGEPRAIDANGFERLLRYFQILREWDERTSHDRAVA